MFWQPIPMSSSNSSEAEGGEEEESSEAVTKAQIEKAVKVIQLEVVQRPADNGTGGGGGVVLFEYQKVEEVGEIREKMLLVDTKNSSSSGEGSESDHHSFEASALYMAGPPRKLSLPEETALQNLNLERRFTLPSNFMPASTTGKRALTLTLPVMCDVEINIEEDGQLDISPMSPQQMWDNVREQYGSDLGCSSDSDYVKADSADESQKRKKKNSKKKAKSSEPPSTFSVSNSYQSVTTVDATTPVVPTTPLESPNNNTVFGNDWKEASADETSMVSEDRISNSNSFVGSFSTDFVDTDPTPSSHILENLRHTCMDEQYAISATEIFNVIFGDNSNFYRDYLAQKNCEDTIYGKWNPPADDGNRHRINDYVMPLTNPLGPKSSRIVEDQTLYKESDLGKTYGIDIVTQNYNIPYSEYFQTIVRYSICKTGVRSSELKVSAEVRFLKKPWGMVKTFIENNAYSGIADNFNKMKIELADFVSQNFSQKKSDETTTTTAAAATEQQQSRSNAVNSENSAATVAGDHDTTTTTVRQRRGTNEGDSGKARAFSNHHVTSPRGPVASLAEGESAGGTIGNIVESVVSGFTSVCTNTSTYTKMLALFIVVLLYSNYSMHQRLVTLEKVMETESVRSDDAPSSTHQFPTADSKEWKMLENLLGVVLKRIEQLEATFKEHIQMESKWLNEQRSSWNVFENKVTTALENRDNL